MKYLLSVGLLLSIIFFAFTYKTERTITGKVTDNKGQPVAFATVTVKGTKIATTTDANGEFSIKVTTDNAILIVSAVGYRDAEIKTSGLNKVEVKLKPTSSALQEVVGYTTIDAEAANVTFSQLQRSKSYSKFSPPKIVADEEVKQDFDEDIDDSWRFNNNFNTEGYDKITENPFLKVNDNPLSTFSID